MALPYVIEGLLDQSSSAQACAIAYNEWRLELQADSYQMQHVPPNHLESSGLGSLETLKAMGTKLQQLMNSLNAEFIHLKKKSQNRKRKQAEGDETDIFEDDDAQSQISASSKAGHVEVGCDNDDNVYNNDNGAEIPEKNDITGNELFVSISTETNLHISCISHDWFKFHPSLQTLQGPSSFTKLDIGLVSLKNLVHHQTTMGKPTKLRTSGTWKGGLAVYPIQTPLLWCLLSNGTLSLRCMEGPSFFIRNRASPRILWGWPHQWKVAQPSCSYLRTKFGSNPGFFFYIKVGLEVVMLVALFRLTRLRLLERFLFVSKNVFATTPIHFCPCTVSDGGFVMVMTWWRSPSQMKMIWGSSCIQCNPTSFLKSTFTHVL